MSEPAPRSFTTRKSVVSIPEALALIDEAMDEIERELGVRHRCYDRWVAEGKLTSTEAVRRWTHLHSALTHLTAYKRLLDIKPTVLDVPQGPQLSAIEQQVAHRSALEQ